MKKQFVGSAPDSVVTEMMCGIVHSHEHIARVSTDPSILLDKDFQRLKKRQVTLISGGGSGHEPSHAGFIGRGMLTAVVCGGVFSSPSVNQILHAIRLVSGAEFGTLLIVKNYTGDRLNFGLAMAQARAQGLKVDMLIVADDVAIPHATATGRRGLCGTILVHKIAGALAKAGLPLHEIVEIMKNNVLNSIATMGVCLTPCTLPGQQPNDRLMDTEVELGLGIHGEPGLEKIQFCPVDDLINTLLTKMLLNVKQIGRMDISAGDEVVLVINNLGATPLMELYIVAHHTMKYLKAEGIVVQRVLTGSFMTSLDMAGCSITLWKIPKESLAGLSQGEVLSHFDSEVGAPAWPVGSSMNCTQKDVDVEIEDIWFTVKSRPDSLSEFGKLMESIIVNVAQKICEIEDEITNLDLKVGDGDCGITLRKGATQIKEDVKNTYALNDPVQLVYDIASSIRKSMGGTSGVLYDIFFTTAANCLAELKSKCESGVKYLPTAGDWILAFKTGIGAIEEYGGASEGSRTMLDALIPASKALSMIADISTGPSSTDLKNVVLAAKNGAESTKVVPVENAFGRTSYLSNDTIFNTPDPGAVAVAAWIESICSILDPDFK